MKLSIIIPVLNESAHIETLLSSITQLDSVPKEIWIVDGGSQDGTKEKVQQISTFNPNVNLVDNPERYVSQGFNRAFRLSNGKYVSLAGAHAIYPPQYFSACIQAIESGSCDAAGGFLVQRGKTLMGQAIAQVMSSPFGVGDTPFRTQRKRMYVDSVAFAVYDRKVFEKAGLLDEELIRNQDDEFHYRLNRAGFRILMLPELEVIYYVRDSLSKLFSQYYQYGFYKPLVFRKVSSGIRLRHLIPSLFVLYLFTLPLALWIPLWALPIVIYILQCLCVSLATKASLPVRMRMPVVFPVLHTAYGLGFWAGIMAMGAIPRIARKAA